MTTYPQQSSASIEVGAAPEVVWDLVADITRMGEWSPECVRAEWEDGATGPKVGAHFHGYNRAGTFEWDVPCVVTDCEPGRLFAFAVPRGGAAVNAWRFDFAPSGKGTPRRLPRDARADPRGLIASTTHVIQRVRSITRETAAGSQENHGADRRMTGEKYAPVPPPTTRSRRPIATGGRAYRVGSRERLGVEATL